MAVSLELRNEVILISLLYTSPWPSLLIWGRDRELRYTADGRCRIGVYACFDGGKRESLWILSEALPIFFLNNNCEPPCD